LKCFESNFEFGLVVIVIKMSRIRAVDRSGEGDLVDSSDRSGLIACEVLVSARSGVVRSIRAACAVLLTSPPHIVSCRALPFTVGSSTS
jgi:hypothetical protein